MISIVIEAAGALKVKIKRHRQKSTQKENLGVNNIHDKIQPTKNFMCENAN